MARDSLQQKQRPRLCMQQPQACSNQSELALYVRSTLVVPHSIINDVDVVVVGAVGAVVYIEWQSVVLVYSEELRAT